MNNTINEYDENKIELIDLSTIFENAWKGLRVFWWIFLILIISYSSFCYLKAKFTYEPSYRATAVFVVQMNQSGSYSNNYYDTAAAEQMGKTFPYILNSGILQKLVAKDLGLETVPGTISAEAIEGQNLFELSVTGSDPQLSYDILQSVIENYPVVAEYVIGDTRLHILDETGVPEEPFYAPDFMAAARTGALKMMLLCAVILVIYAMTRNTVRKEEDLKTHLNIKCLGSIPMVYFKKKSSPGRNQVLIDNQKIPQMFKESIRTLRTRTLKECRNRENKIIMVTSSMPGEGKSTVTVNLALSLAQRGHSIILIDGDLRHPSLAGALGMKRESYRYGFHDVITGKASFHEALIPYGNEKIGMLLGSDAVESTERILSLPLVRNMIQKAGEMVDYVILDTPPCGMLADASILASYADCAVFVVRQDAVRKDRVLDAVQTLSETGVHMAGWVLNCAQGSRSGYGKYSYGKYGYGRYGYGYGRGNSERKEKDREKDRSNFAELEE